MTPRNLWDMLSGRQTNYRWANASWTYYPTGDPMGKKPTISPLQTAFWRAQILAYSIVLATLAFMPTARANNADNHARLTRYLQTENLIPNNPYPGTYYRPTNTRMTNRPPFKDYKPARGIRIY